MENVKEDFWIINVFFVRCTIQPSLNLVYWGLNALNYENCGNQLKLIHIVHYESSCRDVVVLPLYLMLPLLLYYDLIYGMDRKVKAHQCFLSDFLSDINHVIAKLPHFWTIAKPRYQLYSCLTDLILQLMQIKQIFIFSGENLLLTIIL